jgi:tryptophan-rich sensory protein
LASLRVPRWALPFRAWIIVGAIYYVLCFVVLFRLLTVQPSDLRTSALAATVMLMAANAAFNLVLFRWGDLRTSFLFFFPYSGLAIGLFVLLLLVDPLASAVFGPYLVYFVYATAWGYQVWRLNRGTGTAPKAPKQIAEPDSRAAGPS